MNINQPTQFNPGETAYTNTVLDNIKGEPNVNGGRNILQELLFSPWMAEGWKDFKKPWLVDLMRSALGENIVGSIENWAVPPKEKQKGEPFLDFTGRDSLSHEQLMDAWENLPTYNKWTKWKGAAGKKYIDMPTPTRLDKHNDFPIESFFEFAKFVDMYGLPDKKGKFYEAKTQMRNQ